MNEMSVKAQVKECRKNSLWLSIDRSCSDIGKYNYRTMQETWTTDITVLTKLVQNYVRLFIDKSAKSRFSDKLVKARIQELISQESVLYNELRSITDESLRKQKSEEIIKTISTDEGIDSIIEWCLKAPQRVINFIAEYGEVIPFIKPVYFADKPDDTPIVDRDYNYYISKGYTVEPDVPRELLDELSDELDNCTDANRRSEIIKTINEHRVKFVEDLGHNLKHQLMEHDENNVLLKQKNSCFKAIGNKTVSSMLEKYTVVELQDTNILKAMTTYYAASILLMCDYIENYMVAQANGEVLEEVASANEDNFKDAMNPPIYEEPTEEPVVEQPVVEEPVIEVPTEQPVVEVPTEEPTVEVPPVIEVPTEQPVVEVPTEEPVVDTPTEITPVEIPPIVEEPVVETPVEEPVEIPPVEDIPMDNDTGTESIPTENTSMETPTENTSMETPVETPPVEDVPTETSMEETPVEDNSMETSMEEVPTVQETIPTVQETIPTVQETIPTVQETIPTVQETIPTVQETIPTVQETIPTVQETIPTIQETIPTIPVAETFTEEVPIVKETIPIKEIQVTHEETNPIVKDETLVTQDTNEPMVDVPMQQEIPPIVTEQSVGTSQDTNTNSVAPTMNGVSNNIIKGEKEMDYNKFRETLGNTNNGVSLGALGKAAGNVGGVPVQPPVVEQPTQPTVDFNKTQENKSIDSKKDAYRILAEQAATSAYINGTTADRANFVASNVITKIVTTSRPAAARIVETSYDSERGGYVGSIFPITTVDSDEYNKNKEEAQKMLDDLISKLSGRNVKGVDVSEVKRVLASSTNEITDYFKNMKRSDKGTGINKFTERLTRIIEILEAAIQDPNTKFRAFTQPKTKYTYSLKGLVIKSSANGVDTTNWYSNDEAVNIIQTNTLGHLLADGCVEVDPTTGKPHDKAFYSKVVKKDGIDEVKNVVVRASIKTSEKEVVAPASNTAVTTISKDNAEKTKTKILHQTISILNKPVFIKSGISENDSNPISTKVVELYPYASVNSNELIRQINKCSKEYTDKLVKEKAAKYIEASKKYDADVASAATPEEIAAIAKPFGYGEIKVLTDDNYNIVSRPVVKTKNQLYNEDHQNETGYVKKTSKEYTAFWQNNATLSTSYDKKVEALKKEVDTYDSNFERLFSGVKADIQDCKGIFAKEIKKIENNNAYTDADKANACRTAIETVNIPTAYEGFRTEVLASYDAFIAQHGSPCINEIQTKKFKVRILIDGKEDTATIGYLSSATDGKNVSAGANKPQGVVPGAQGTALGVGAQGGASANETPKSHSFSVQVDLPIYKMSNIPNADLFLSRQYADVINNDDAKMKLFKEKWNIKSNGSSKPTADEIPNSFDEQEIIKQNMKAITDQNKVALTDEVRAGLGIDNDAVLDDYKAQIKNLIDEYIAGGSTNIAPIQALIPGITKEQIKTLIAEASYDVN